MTKSGSSGGEGVIGKRRARFNSWRRGRPFAGGVLLILASFVIAWIPIHIAPDIILLGKALSPIFGLLFAAMIFLCGMFALTRPELADIFGILGIVFSIFSLYGALGGLFIGLFLGIIGGTLCYAWIDEDEEESGGSGGTDETTESEESAFDFGGTSSEEDSDGLFGSRSVRRGTDSSGSRGAGGPIPSVALFVLAVVVLGAFAHPFVAAAAQQSFPEQAQIEGTVVIAQQFAGTSYNHENVTTDTSTRESVPAARLSFETASIQGLTIYKNFRTGPQTPFYIKITGASASANRLSITTSEAYFATLGIGAEPAVIPAARKKWTTCPGKDFLLSVGDLGPLPGPPVDASGVVLNTHQMTASSITIENLTLVVKKGAKSTQVSGTPECTTNPIEPVLELFTANALALLTDNGVIPPEVVTSGTVTDLTAPANVTQGETFDASATVTNTGYVNNTTTVEFRFDNETRRTKDITLGPGESQTVRFTNITTGDKSEGTYTYGVFTENASATGTIAVVNETNTTSATMNETDVNAMAVNTTTASANETSPTAETNGTFSSQTLAGQNATTNDTTSTAATATTTTAANDTANETTTPAANESTNETETTPTSTAETPTSTETATPVSEPTTTTTSTPTTTPKPTTTLEPTTTTTTATTSTATQTPAGTTTTDETTTPTVTTTPKTTTEGTTSTSDGQPLLGTPK